MNRPSVFPPRPSRSSRDLDQAIGGRCRGSLVGPDGRIRAFDSDSEARTTEWFLARPDVRDVIEQPPAITYRDTDGKTRSYTFDQLVEYTDGERVLVEVKAPARAASPNFQKKIRHLAAQIPPDVAARVIVVTRRDLDRVATDNARLINSARKDRVQPLDASVETYVAERSNVMTIAEIVRDLGDGRAFRSIVRLIGRGILTPVSGASITPALQVRYTGTEEAR
ncbi:hypothetical protein ASF08_17105 [Methylobacterium sp. Leaf85]|uniref:TnsA endonuclease N-terminal domain-containing protein n=2 Tax=Methylobacteriaceae TaxID=119045 RepID=A0A679JZP4_9HYPH|nr:hypothetical protein ASF08_17105 [Methylobacterium sp. Leaf85]CAA2145120.1 hypothetical protein MBLL_04242 [Methylobacterium bullatum]